MMTHYDESHCTTNVQVVLCQVATGERAEHLKVQLACLQNPICHQSYFFQLEHHLGTVFKQFVSDNLLATCKEKRDLAIPNGKYHCRVPAITVVMDGGWNKRSHKHSYNAKSGLAIIFGPASYILWHGSGTDVSICLQYSLFSIFKSLCGLGVKVVIPLGS